MATPFPVTDATDVWQNIPLISMTSSRSSTRMIPVWPNTASCTASEPVRWPV